MTDPTSNARVTFILCTSSFDKLNSGGGIVKPGPGCLPQKSNTTSDVFFFAGAPAWQITPTLQDCPLAGAASPIGKWETGFIQTVESATYGAGYDSGQFIADTVSNTRDATSSAVAPPWYDSPGTNFGPRVYNTGPAFADSPFVKFPITHPQPSSKSPSLRSVCMKGKFNLWLIVNKKGAAPTASSVGYLFHWSIRMEQNYLLNWDANAHPCNKSQWSTSGGIRVDSSGGGKGPANPSWSTTVANAARTRDTAVTGDPCTEEIAPAPDRVGDGKLPSAPVRLGEKPAGPKDLSPEMKKLFP
jgi:hypothetical protein